MAVPTDLIYYVVPAVRDWEASITAAQAAAVTDHQRVDAQLARTVLGVVKYILASGIQDAYEIADQFPTNPFFAKLLANPTFK